MAIGALISLSLLIAASAQPPPAWPEGVEREVVVPAGETAEIEIRALDPLARKVSYAAEGLPQHAVLDPERGRASAVTLRWTPADGQVGEHHMSITATSESGSATQVLKLVVERHWEGYLVPGLAYSTYLPFDANKWGFLQGISIQFQIFSWIHQNERPGPAFGRVYLDLDVLASSKSNVYTELDVSAGVSLSFERNPTRNFLIPYYGLELGTLFAKQLTSPLLHVTPLAGVHLFANAMIAVNLGCGYLLPLRGAEFDELRGVRAKLGVDVAFW